MGLDARATPLAELRRVHGLRREEIAARSGCSLRTVARIERGQLDGVKLLTLVRIAYAVGVRPADLVPALALDPPAPGLIQARAKTGR